MKRMFHVSPKSKSGVTASRHLGNPRKRSRMSGVRSSRSVRRKNTVTAAKIYTDGFGNYQPWSGAVDTWENLEKFDKLDALEAYLDEEYYNEELGEGTLSETELNDLLWFEPEHIYEMVGLYYDYNTGEVSDEPFDDYDEESE
ncbi:MAG: hypothetical protein J6C92_14745 [Bacteroidaceae bacterium]|nr:hypothetical protein [Bacteroidaceae bacterium]